VTPSRVLHVAESAGWAGGETYLLTLATGLDRGRFELAAILPEPGVLGGRLQALGVPVHTVPLAARLVSPSALLALARVLRRERPAIVQSHGARTNVYTRLAARLARVPVILSTVHNSLFDYEVGGARRRAYVLAERLTSPLADRIVAVSGAVERDLIERYRIRADRVVTIRNGIDADRFRPSRPPAAVREELALAPDAPVVGVVGRLTPQKGHAVLLRALPPLVRRFPRLRCLVVGDGPLDGALRREAEALGLAGHCRFTGARPDVADLLSVLDVVVLPSFSEGLPFVLLEAMALGRPVVATRVGGNPEVVEDTVTGLLVPPGDPAAVADAVARLLDRPAEARLMAECGRARVRAAFSLERMIRALEELYTILLSGAGWGSGRAT